MTAGATGPGGWSHRVGVEAAPGAQPDENGRSAAREAPLQLHGIVASVEDEQGHAAFALGQPVEQGHHLPGGHLVGVLRRADPPRVHGGHPTLPREADLGDPLVGPAGHDGLAGGVARGMVVEAALGARLGVAACPHAHVHGVDRRSLASEGVADHQRAQGLGVDPSPFQRRVEATPTATVRGFEAQVNGRRDDARGEHRVADLEERVGAPIEAAVERAAEGTQIVKGCGGVHDDGFCSPKPSAATFTVPPLPGWLKHKLR